MADASPPRSHGGSSGNLAISSSPDSKVGGKTHSSFSTSSSASNPDAPKCGWCGDAFRDPRVLACFHSFCRACLEAQLQPGVPKLVCPACRAETTLAPELGLESLLVDFGLLGKAASPPVLTAVDSPPDSVSSSSSPGLELGREASTTCTGCKSKESGAVAHCQDCANFLCQNCVMAHQYMHCFEGHRVRDLTDFDHRSLNLLAAATADRPVACLSHRGEAVRYFCFTCNVPICRDCTTERHPRPAHQFDAIQEIADKQLDTMATLLADARAKRSAVELLGKQVEGASGRLRAAHAAAHSAVADNAAALIALVEEQRAVAFKELETTHGTKQVSLALLEKKLGETGEKLGQTIEFMGRLLSAASPTEALVFKQLLETRLQSYLAFPTDGASLSAVTELAYVPNSAQHMRNAVTGIFGYVRTGGERAGAVGAERPPPTPIGRPPSRSRFISLNLNPGNPILSPGQLSSSLGDSGLGVESPPFTESLLKGSAAFGGSSQSLGPFPSFNDGGAVGGGSLYEKWSTTGNDLGLGSLSIATPESLTAAFPPSPDTGGLLDAGPPQHHFPDTRHVPMGGPPPRAGGALVGLFPPRSQIKRHKMIYHCKFGEFGVLESQFTEPSGVCVNGANDIIVADTNNHRIQVFDREGRFKFQFGECGKRDGQLLYPNRVAVNRATGDIVVTERSPTHQIQVYNQYGQFLRKFGANILQHPRGVTVDAKGRIVVIECKVMRVLIFDMYGSILQKFSCSRYLEFPNGVCTNDRQEIFISDNRAHCIKVFNYEGQFLRQLGGEGVTNYPIGVGINQHGEVVVADNHNNFNLTLFTQDGTLVNALESKVKHAQCFDVALLEEGSVVLASKDYRLYLYRYLQTQNFPM